MRFVRHAVPILALLSLRSVPLAAQNTGTISGRVTDSTTQQSLSGVSIQVVGTARRTLTADDGTFQLTDVPAGIQQLRATRIGYSLQQQQVTVTAGATASVELALNPHAMMLAAIVATGYGTQSRRD